VEVSGLGLTLRPWTAADVDALTRIMNDADVALRTPLPSPFTRSDADEYLSTRDGYVDLAILDEAGSVVGQIMLNRLSHMASYVIDSTARGRGYAVRALSLLCAAAQTWGLSSVGLEIEPDNTASVRVAERCGFQVSPEPPEEVTDKGRTYRLQVWRLAFDPQG
jgi:RimJ/RimL family protein N-acetyltransferase